MAIDARGKWIHRVGVLAAAAVLAGCGSDANAEGSDPAETEPVGRIINVEVEPLARGPFTEVIRLTGVVEANRDVIVSAEESGVVRELLVAKGRRVAQDTPILKIDDALLVSQVAQAEAQSALAEETWQRRKRLWEEDQVGSELAYLEAKFSAEQEAANLATLRERLERTTVRAPIGGVLDDRIVEIGTMVSPGTPVARVIDLDPVKVVAGVPERYAADVAPGAEVTVSFDVLDGAQYSGRITFVGSAVDPQSRTFPVEFTLPNPGRVVKPEMVATLALTRRAFEDVIVVPQEALVRAEDGFVVFVVEGGSGSETVTARPVEIGASQRDMAVIDSGLEDGDRIVVVGQKLLASGDRVRIVTGGEQ